MAKIIYREYEIRRSGKDLWRIYQQGESQFGQRFRSVDAAKAAINATLDGHRVYTPQEWRCVHGERTEAEMALDKATDEMYLAYAAYQQAASASKVSKTSLSGEGWQGRDDKVYAVWLVYNKAWKAADAALQAVMGAK